LVAEATSLRKDPYPVPPPPTAVVKVTPAAYPDAKVKEVSPAPATAGPAGNPTEAKLAVPLSDSSVAHAVYSAPRNLTIIRAQRSSCLCNKYIRHSTFLYLKRITAHQKC